jgi:hypothetical protein
LNNPPYVVKAFSHGRAFLIAKIKNMGNLEELCKTALNGYFNLLSKNDDYLKIRHLINHTAGHVDPEILEKFEKLHNHFESEYKIFNHTHARLIEYLKTTPTKSMTLNINTGLSLEGNYTIGLDESNNLIVKNNYSMGHKH